MGVLSSVYFTFLEVDLNIRNCNTNYAFISEGDNLDITLLETKKFAALAVFLH